MTSPFLQPAWTIEEAILLVEASENISSGRCDAESVTKQLSERLRKGAESSGLSISPRYRNEDDVCNNLKLMSSMLKMAKFFDEDYFQGSTLGAVALYYHKQNDRYAQLLQRANDIYPLISENSISISTGYEDSIQDETIELISEKEFSLDDETLKNDAKSEEALPVEVVLTRRVSEVENISDINAKKIDINNYVVEDQERGIDNEIISDENENIDTANEAIATYAPPRRRRPRVSGERIGSYKSELSFTSVFPYYSQVKNYDTNENKYLTGNQISPSVSLSSNDSEGTKNSTFIEKDGIQETNNFRPTQKEIQKNSTQEKLTNVRQELIRSFSRGYRLGSPLDLKRFRMLYKSHFGKGIAASDEVLEGYIRNIGFEYKGKVYVADAVLSNDIKDRICGFIIDILSTERDFVFFEHIFNQFKDEIDYTIVDSEMLKLYLKSLNIRNWYIRDKFITSSIDVEVSIKDEVLRFIRKKGTVVNLQEVKQSLDYLPFEEVEHEWNFNGDTLISNGRNEKFHLGIFYCSNNDLGKVSNLINSALDNSSFMTSEGLSNDIHINLPELFANNEHISEIGIRNALGKLLSSSFSFKNNIISKVTDSYDGPAAILAFCKDRGTFTFFDIEEISKEIGCTPNFYLDKIYCHSIRVDDIHFIPRKQISFNVVEIDKVLDLFVNDLFTPVQDIITYDAFPSCGEYAWNKWILENYLLISSKKYRFIHPRYLSKESVTGAIVRKDGILKTYDDLIIQAIANTDIPIEEDEINEYLYDRGLINVKRKNGQVKKVLIKAREYRNRINKNKN